VARRTSDERYDRAARFWGRIFGLNFLMGVVTGIPMEFQFGTNWARFAEAAGGVIGQTGILDWYTVLVGATALVALTIHGALWIVLKTDADLAGRARRLAMRLWVPLGVLMALLTYATFEVQPHIAERLVSRWWGFLFPGLTVAGWLAMRWAMRAGEERRAFLISSSFLAGALGSAFFGIYPYLLPANTDPARGLTVLNSAAPAYGLKVGLMWWIPGMVLVALYFTYVYRRFGGKVTLEEEGY